MQQCDHYSVFALFASHSFILHSINFAMEAMLRAGSSLKWRAVSEVTTAPSVSVCGCGCSPVYLSLLVCTECSSVPNWCAKCKVMPGDHRSAQPPAHLSLPQFICLIPFQYHLYFLSLSLSKLFLIYLYLLYALILFFVDTTGK